MQLLQELLAYHGTGKTPKTSLKPPIFVTTDKDGAQWYASDRSRDGRGIIITGELQVSKPFDIRGRAGLKRLFAMIKSADIPFEAEPYFQCDEIGEHSQYDGSNPNDMVYVPKFIDAVKKAGFDSVHMDDSLESSEIDTYVIWNPAQFKIQKTEKGEAF